MSDIKYIYFEIYSVQSDSENTMVLPTIQNENIFFIKTPH